MYASVAICQTSALSMYSLDSLLSFLFHPHRFGSDVSRSPVSLSVQIVSICTISYVNLIVSPGNSSFDSESEIDLIYTSLKMIRRNGIFGFSPSLPPYRHAINSTIGIGAPSWHFSFKSAVEARSELFVIVTSGNSNGRLLAPPPPEPDRPPPLLPLP